jgi:hypothetical protein
MPRRTLLVVFAALLLPVAACSSSGSGSSSASSGLAAAMDSVSGTGPAAEYFEYGDVAALRTLGVVHPDAAAGGSGTPIDQRWGRVAGVGASDLAAYSVVLVDLIKVNILAADTAVAIGTPPNLATRVDGAVDPKTVTAKLTALGAKPRSFDGTAGLSFGPDNVLNSSSKLAEDPRYGALSIVLDQIVATDHTFATSRNAATLEKVLSPGDTSLLDTPHFSDLAGCLGDVVAAIVVAPQHDTQADLIGVGVRTPASADAAADEVLCILPSSGNQDSVHTSLEQRLAPTATDPIAHSPVSQYVAKTAVDDTGDLVRAVLSDAAKTTPGYLIVGLSQNLAAYWDGSCTSADVAGRKC